jgi:hypothetical protein
MHWQLIYEARDGQTFPRRRFGGIAWYCNQALWLFGGCPSIEEEKQLSDLWCFELATQTWMPVSRDVAELGTLHRAPSGRLTPASWVERSTLFMYGGAIGATPSRELWLFDTQKYIWVEDERAQRTPQSTPGIRSGSVAWNDGENRSWLFGGIGESSSGDRDILGDLWSYSSETGSWSLEADVMSHRQSLPHPRTHASQCLSSKYCWVFGGLDRSRSGGAFADLWSFEKHTGVAKQWWAGADLDSGLAPTNRSGAVLFSDRFDNVYVFGGQQTHPREHLNDLWKFELSSQKWLNLPCNAADAKTNRDSSPGPRSDSSAWLDRDGRLWLFGGYGTNSHGDPDALGDLWLLEA